MTQRPTTPVSSLKGGVSIGAKVSSQPTTLTCLSLGAGVQSSTVFLMVCDGVLPKLDCAIFADTGWEPPAVYEHLAWLEKRGRVAGIPVYRVSAGNLRADALVSQVRGKAADGTRWASMPLFTLKIWTPDETDEFEQVYLAGEVAATGPFTLIGEVSDDGHDYLAARHAELDKLRRGLAVTHRGMIRRQCTSEYKIEPIDRFIRRRLLGLEPGQRVANGTLVHQWFGISTDEATRMRQATDPWRVNVYPLIGIPQTFLPSGMTRADCQRWLKEHYPTRTVPRSACIGCPYHSDDEWRAIKSDPMQWADAVEFDRSIRDCGGIRGQVFLHRSCVALEDVDLRSEDARVGQLAFGWANECEGMCGV